MIIIMFRDVLGCYRMFHVPDFIDGRRALAWTVFTLCRKQVIFRLCLLHEDWIVEVCFPGSI